MTVDVALPVATSVVRVSTMNLVLLVVALELFCSACGSLLFLGDNGYENVVVALDERLAEEYPAEDCSTILNSLKAWVSAGSASLCSATASRASIKSVAVIIPEAWDSVCGGSQSPTWPRRRLANVQVGLRHPVSGDRPITFQYGGCGDPGTPTYVPVEYLLDRDPSRAGAEFLHQWAQHRYGVFDETGIPGDPQYPAGFSIEGLDFQPNSCTDQPINGQWEFGESCGTVSHPDCQWFAVPEENSHIKSSLMYRTDFPGMNEFCRQETHKIEAPNKQNLYCEGRSVLDVVLSHKDFQIPAGGIVCNQEPVFTFTTNPFRGYLIILDASSAMGKLTGMFETAVESLKQFVYHLPDGIVVYLMTYSAKVEWINNRTVINEEAKKHLIQQLDSLPAPSPGGAENAIESALTEAAALYNDGLDFILLTATSSPPVNFAQIAGIYRQKKIPVHVLSFGLNTFPDLYTLTLNGQLASVPDWNPDDPAHVSRTPLTFATGILMNIYSQTVNERIKIHEVGHSFSSGSKLSGYFFADTTGDELMVLFSSSSSDLSIQLWTTTNNYSVVPVDGTWFWKADLKITNFTAPQQFQYVVQSSNSSARVSVDVWIDNPSASESVLVKAWPSSTGNIPFDLKTGPLSLHAQVTQDLNPVDLSAQIVAKVYGANPSNKVVLLGSVPLSDKGTAADVTGGDGIYSGYPTVFSGNKKKYPVVVEISNTRSARVCYDYGDLSSPLAGSVLPASNCSPTTVSWSRYVYGIDFQLTSVYSGDVIPPGRITDLKVDWDQQAWNGTLYWTAPSDNYGTAGQADRYVVLMQVGPTGNWSELYRGHLAADNNMVAYNFTVKDLNGLVVFRVKAIDSSNNTSPASNAAVLFLQDPSSASTHGTQTPGSLGTSTSRSDSWSESTISSVFERTTTAPPAGMTTPAGTPWMVPYDTFAGILAAFILTLILLLVLGLLYYFKIRIVCVFQKATEEAVNKNLEKIVAIGSFPV